MSYELDDTVLGILYRYGAGKIILSREDIGDEIVFADETEVLEFFNQNVWKGKTIIFSPPNTAQLIGTLAKPTNEFVLNGKKVIISKLQIKEGE